jgi:pectinesterase
MMIPTGILALLLLLTNAACAEGEREIVVSPDGSAAFRTIAGALASLPADRTPVVIVLRPGLYAEKVFIRRSHVTIVGEDRATTRIVYPELRETWRAAHGGSDWGAGVVNIDTGVMDVTLANLTVRNNHGSLYGSTGHQFAVRGMGTRIMLLHCTIASDGGDALSLWNKQDGMYYHRDCRFEGGVDFVCPRGWCYITGSTFFSHSTSAAIWHDGDADPRQKLVITRSFFDGIAGFPLGRNHRDGQIYLVDCRFSANMADRPIYHPPGSATSWAWGARHYYAGCSRTGGNYDWFADNLHTAPGSPRPDRITAAWAFDGRWDPEASMPSGSRFAFLRTPEPASPGLRIEVRNPSEAARGPEPVVVSWREVLDLLPGAAQGALQVRDERGEPVRHQLDDLNLDGTPDELVFMAGLSAREVRVFALNAAAPLANVVEPFRTDAQIWKRIEGVLQGVDDDNLPGDRRDRTAYRFDGVGWESDSVAYRLYLDGRNAVDVQGKRRPGLYWKWIGSSGVDYQLDADWGTDVLHVGAALGVGGIAFWSGDSVLKPLTVERQRTRVVARGPVRAVVRVDYTGWAVGEERADVVSLFTIYAGERVTEHRVTVQGTPAPLVTGIVRHDSTTLTWLAEQGLLFTSGHQSRQGDTLLLAVQVDPRRVERRTEDAANHLLILRPDGSQPVRMLITALWQGETRGRWPAEDLPRRLPAAGRRMTEPLQIRIRHHDR